MDDSENEKRTPFADAKKRLASNPDTHPDTLEKLADKGSHDIVQRVAENISTPEPVFEKLANHESPEIRSAVSHNPSASLKTKEPLATDSDPSVRFSVAENPNTPLEILSDLAEDENAYVSERAKQTLNKMAEVKGLLNHADELFLKGAYDKSEALYKQLLQQQEPLIGPTHMEIAQIKHKLAAALAGQGKADEALKYEDESKLIMETNQGNLET